VLTPDWRSMLAELWQISRLERITHIDEVGGSSPSAPTKKAFMAFFDLME